MKTKGTNPFFSGETTINPRNPPGGGNSSEIRINHRIRAREVRVIGADGSQLGVMDTRKALELAMQQGLDLAEISPTSNPPVCKILDHGKYKYEQKKKAQKAKKNQVVTQLKEIQFRPNTDTHDIEYKVKHIKEFLEDGDKVKVLIRFRGREASHADLGYALLKQIVDMVGNLGIVEQSTKMEGKLLHLVFGPNKTLPKKAPTKPEAQTSTAPVTPQAPSSVAKGSVVKTATAAGSPKSE